jgi:hypothetical protein
MGNHHSQTAKIGVLSCPLKATGSHKYVRSGSNQVSGVIGSLGKLGFK